MSEHVLARLVEHNNWANLQVIQACSALSDDQLDAQPQSATKGTIRQTLMHFVGSQQGYLSLLTLPLDARPITPLEFTGLQNSATRSGEALLELARDESKLPKTQLQTRDGYYVEPWVVMVQVINHATEHREQICSMLSSLGVTPPGLDGWSYGEATNTLVPISN